MKTIFICTLMLISITVFAETNNEMDNRLTSVFGEYEPYKEFFFEFKDKVKSDDIDALSEMMSFPLNVNGRVNKKIIKTKNEFVSEFDEIFTTGIRRVVLEQEYNDLFVSYRGMMYGDGEVWVSGICAPDSPLGECKDLQIKVISINKLMHNKALNADG